MSTNTNETVKDVLTGDNNNLPAISVIGNGRSALAVNNARMFHHQSGDKPVAYSLKTACNQFTAGGNRLLSAIIYEVTDFVETLDKNGEPTRNSTKVAQIMAAISGNERQHTGARKIIVALTNNTVRFDAEGKLRSVKGKVLMLDKPKMAIAERYATDGASFSNDALAKDLGIRGEAPDKPTMLKRGKSVYRAFMKEDPSRGDADWLKFAELVMLAVHDDQNKAADRAKQKADAAGVAAQ